MPVYEKHQIVGLQATTDDKAIPSLLKEESGLEVLIVFSSPEIGKDFLQKFPDYAGGLLTDLKWVVGKIGTDHAISINPDIEVGFDLDSKTIE